MQVQLLGEPCGFAKGQWHRFIPDRRYQLLAYLAYMGGWVSRERLADVFWSNLTQHAARANLRKVIFKLKSLQWLAEFEHHDGAARWQVKTDVAAFLEATEAKNYIRALELYKGPFLQGFKADDNSEFDAWIESERAWLDQRYQEVIGQYVSSLEQKADFETALSVLQRALMHDPLNESHHQSVMRLEWKRGNTEAALAQFEHCRETLQSELGVEPLQETLDLLQTIEARGFTGTKYALLLKRPDSVPEAPATLFGRDVLLKEAFTRLQHGEHILLHGFGGMGKTVLAAALARQWLETYPTTVLWLQVGSDNPDTIFEAISRPFEAQQALAQAQDKTKILHDILNQYVNDPDRFELAKQKSHSLGLLVLDDVWNAYTLSKVLEAVPDTLPVLVTSRQRYPKLTRLYVDRLERSASLELLTHHAGFSPLAPAEMWNSNPDSNQLCQLLGDHAFAIRLSGMALREEGTTIKELLARIREAPHDLKVPGELKHEGRESVAALLNVSLETLNDQEYEAFLTYGVLPTPSVTPELLARCARRDPHEIELALFTLVQRGLAERVSRPGNDLVSYRIHDLAHSYARSNRWQRITTFIQATLGFLQHHKDDLGVLDAEISNVLAAAQAAKERGLEAELVKFMYLLTVEGTYYTARGHTTRSIELLKAAAETAQQQESLEESHYLYGKLGDYYQNFVLDFERAVATYDKAMGLARKTQNKGREAVFLSAIGQVKTRQNKDDAETYLAQAYHLAKVSRDDLSLCLILEKLGYVEGMKENFVKAAQFLRESLGVVEGLKNRVDISQAEVQRRHFFALLNLGEAEGSLGNHNEALLIRQKALTIAEQDGNELWIAYAHYEIGEMSHLDKNRQLAQHHMRQALELFERNNAKKDADNVLNFLKNEGYDPGHDS